MIHWSFVVATEAVEQKASLFGFDATLPIIVVEFLILMTVLKATFFGPLTEQIDSRNDYVRDTASGAKSKLSEAETLAVQYKKDIAQTRISAQATVADAQAEASAIRNQKVIEAQQEAQAKVDAARLEVEKEKQAALSALEAEVAELSDSLIAKLLGAAA